MYTFLPSLVLIVVNIGLIRLVKQKEKRSFNKSNLTLLMIITAVFIVSYAPYVVKYSIPILGMKTDVLSNWFKTLMNFMLYTNSWFNPFAYYSTNAAFRNFTHCVITCKPYRPVRGSIVTSAVIIENCTTHSGIDTVRSRSNSASPNMILFTPHPSHHHQRRSVCVVNGAGVLNHLNLPGQGIPGKVPAGRRVTSPQRNSWRPPSGSVIEDSNESAETIA